MTIAERFQKSATAYKNKTALAYLSGQRYMPISYSELDKYRQALAEYYVDNGVRAGDRVAVLLQNCPEWIVADLAAATIGAIIVPVHSTYNQQFVKKIIEHSGAKFLVVGADLFKKFESLLAKSDLDKIFIVGTSKSSGNIKQFPTWSKMSSYASHENIAPKEQDIHTIIYTSGTTGDPKGVMLTHRNILTDVESALRSITLYSKDRFYSFLPLSHAFERTAGFYTPLAAGASIYFASDSSKIVQELALAQPTILTAVPRIFERLYDRIFEKIKSGSSKKRQMFYYALDLSRKNKTSRLRFFQRIILAILDSLALKKIRKILGGRVRLAISGGASLNPRIAKFFDVVGITILEGYGMTESSPIIAVNRLDSYKFGTVGKPLDCNDVRIAENKEIIVRGDNIMKGYYNNREQTDMVVENGWLYTGDLGFIDSEGFLTIIGRAKDVIVLPNGKNIFPEPIEAALNESPFISQSMIYDNDGKISALIVPDFEELKKWAISRDIHDYRDKLNEYTPIRELFDYEINRLLGELSAVEMIKSFKLIENEFSQENGLLTPTLKLRRKKISELFIRDVV